MVKQSKKIRRIYMVSSAVFSAASCVYGWSAPLGAALGLAVNLTEDSSEDIKKEFENAVGCALKRTQDNTTSDSKKKIIDELFEEEVMPDSLGVLIKKTEAYQTRYCTNADVKEILVLFDMFFREEISERQCLSNMYVLSTGFTTLDKLKQINDILITNENKVNEIQKNISRSTKILCQMEKIFSECLRSLAFILVAMAVFLGMGIFMYEPYENNVIIIVFICYGISDFLIFFLNKESKNGSFIFKKNQNMNEDLYCIIKDFLMPITISLSCFWIIVLATDRNNILFPTLALVIGNMTSIFFKKILFRNRDMKIDN